MNTKNKQFKASIDDHHKANVICCKFSPNNKLFFSAGEDNRIIIWDSFTFKRHSVYNMSEPDLKDSAKGRRLLDKTPNQDPNEITNIFSACWSPEGETILVAGLFHLYQIDLQEKEKQVLVEDVFHSDYSNKGELRNLDISPEGERIVISTTFDFKALD